MSAEIQENRLAEGILRAKRGEFISFENLLRANIKALSFVTIVKIGIMS